MNRINLVIDLSLCGKLGIFIEMLILKDIILRNKKSKYPIWIK